MRNDIKEPAKELISLEFLQEIDKIRQEKSDSLSKWDLIMNKIDEFSKNDATKLTPVDFKNSILHCAYGEALLALNKKDQALEKFKLGLSINSLVFS